MGGMEAVITGLADDFKILKKHRKLFTFATAFGTFLFALLCITNVSIPAGYRPSHVSVEDIHFRLCERRLLRVLHD
jgi:hypothetical protein